MSEPATTLTLTLASGAYAIIMEPGSLERAGETIAARITAPRTITVTDENLARSGHLQVLELSLARHGIVNDTITVPAGEPSKSFERLEALLEAMIERGIDRKVTIVAFGGGVVGDLAGFAAAVLLRGVDLVQIPTTLLAQVDSAIGGKTGINSRHGKNLFGAFHQPRLVIVDVGLLDTLSARELRAGYAEVVKYGCILDADFFAWLEENGADLLAGDRDLRGEAVRRSLAIKAAIVEEDERETSGRRALLNFGHTFAHAYERIAGYGTDMLHGEAVAVGMIDASLLSSRLGLAAHEDAQRLEGHLRLMGLPACTRSLSAEGFPVADVLSAMQKDKKAADGAIRFVLWRGIGDAFLCNAVPITEVQALLEARA